MSKANLKETVEVTTTDTLLTEHVVLFLSAALIFVLAFTYEKAFLQYFGIPSTFVSVTDVVVTHFIIIFISVCIFYFFILFAMPSLSLVEKRPNLSTCIFVLAPFYIYFFTKWAILKFPFNELKPLLLGIVLLTFVMALSALGRWKRESRKDPKKKDDKKMGFALILHDLCRKLGPITIVLLIFIYILFQLSSSMGISIARHKENFLTVRIDGKKLAAIRVYGDRGIFVPINSDGTISPDELRMLSLTTLDQPLRNKKIGPLKIAPSKKALKAVKKDASNRTK